MKVFLKDLSFVHSKGTPYETELNFKGELTVDEGEVVILTGKNGSGKTTFLQMVAILIKPRSGIILFDGEDPWRNPWKFRREIGFSFQFPENQFFEMSVYEEVVFAPKNFGFSDLEERYEEAMRIVGMDPDEFRDRIPFSLSGGEKRKIAVASIISHDPSLLILDEPLVGLDVPSRKEMIAFLKRWKEMGKSAIVATHKLKEFEKLADKVVRIENGELISG